MTLSLPVGPPPLTDSKTAIVGAPKRMGQRSLFTVTVTDADFEDDPPRKVELRTDVTNGASLTVREVRVTGKTTLDVLADGPPKTPSSQGDTTRVELRPTVETAAHRFEGASWTSVTMAWGPPVASAKATLATTFGSTGTLVTIAFADPKGFGPTDVESVRLGTKIVSPTSPAVPGGWWKTENSIQLLCPEPDAGAATVDVLLDLTPAGTLKNNKDSRLRIGSFTYIRPKE